MPIDFTQPRPEPKPAAKLDTKILLSTSKKMRDDLDRAARRGAKSRNAVIREACEKFLYDSTDA